MSERQLQEEIESLKAEVKRLRKILNEQTPPLSALLRRRGFKIYKKEPKDDLLIPEKAFLDSYYEMMKKYSFRLFLRDVIKNQPLFTLSQVTRYATRDVTAEYIEYLLKIKMLKQQNNTYSLIKGNIKSFGETLEWFIAEIFKREISAEAIWGIKMKRPNIGGDYDLIAKINGFILYMEIKSSPPRQIYQNELTAFLDRVYDLMPEIAIFFIDTELRMKDKIVPMFEEEMRKRYALPPDIVRIEKELFEIKIERPKVFIINAKDSIIANIEKVISRYLRRIE